MTDLFWSGHEVNGGVIVVILLKQTEGELVVNQKVVCLKRPKDITVKAFTPPPSETRHINYSRLQKYDSLIQAHVAGTNI